ncbi:MAG TPA: HEAT repeat domain-containing protein [Polyangiaceae bacterium]|nr:HEAT repeat domain-containing protein [Polyangiaceae bacterium]
MIEWYDGFNTFIDLDEHLSRARRLHKQNDLSAATWELIKGLHNVHSDESSWQRGARALYELFLLQQLPREALTVAWYLNDVDAMNPLLEHVDFENRARTWSGQAHLGLIPASDERKHHGRAAAAFESAGMLVHAAVSYEHAHQVHEARALWSRLAHRLETEVEAAYPSGLALFNLARTSQAQGDASAAFEATVGAVHHLEEAADHFESIGQRERAFDCYHVLIAIGGLTGAFEHLLEGSVNAIRILREDNLKHHALRLYQQTLDRAEATLEYAAAATLAREMTEYAAAQGLDAVADHALSRQARAWQKLAAHHHEHGAPMELTHAALHASLIAHAELGQYASVARQYAELAETSTNPRKQQIYRRAHERTAGASDVPAPPADPSLGQHHPPPEVWFDDLIEWEEAGSASARCAGIILDPAGVDDRTTRRSAVLGRLAALATETTSREAAYALEVLANHLAPIGLYAVLPALEKLYEHAEPGVRVAAVRALGRHSYKRSFVTFERAVVDSETEVRQAAVEEIRRQRFEHAFDPLARIYRQSDYQPARLAALHALGQIDLREAHEILFGALEHGTLEEATAAAQTLVSSRSRRFLETARAALRTASPQLVEALRNVARQRGDAL